MSAFQIQVRAYGGTNIASAVGLGLRASCTSSAQQAVEALIPKILAKHGGRAIGLRQVVSGIWQLDTDMPREGRAS